MSIHGVLVVITDPRIAVNAAENTESTLVWGSHDTSAESRRNAVPIAQIKRAVDGSVSFESLTRRDGPPTKEDPCELPSDGDEDFSNGPLLCSTAAYVWGSYGYDAKVKRDPVPVGILKRGEGDSLSFQPLDTDAPPTKEDPCELPSDGDEDFSNGPLLCSTAAYVWGSYGYDDAGPNDAVPVAQVKRANKSLTVRATEINSKRDAPPTKEDPCELPSDGDEDFSNGPLLCSTAAYVWGSYGYDA